MTARRVMPPVFLAFALAAARAGASPDPIDARARAAYEEGHFTFCQSPPRPMRPSQRRVCALAAEMDGCDALKAACADVPTPRDEKWLARLFEALAPLATALLYVLVAAIVLVVAIPVVRAIAGRRKKARIADSSSAPNVALLLPEEPAEAGLGSADTAFDLAEAARARGDLGHALRLYLASSLAALDRRGAIHVARGRTNGEYVRSCSEESARAPLREVVRAVDEVAFGGQSPTAERAETVSLRARAIVKAALAVTTVLALVGCGSLKRGADPTGDELPIEVLQRSGFQVGPLETSLASLPLPKAGERAPVVLLDLERVTLEVEARVQLRLWVEAGGTLILLGHPEEWPVKLTDEPASTTERDLVVLEREAFPEEVHARVARADAFREIASAERIARVGDRTYAATTAIGSGQVLGIANDDLFTNAGVLHRHNATALVALVRAVADEEDGPHRIRIARAQDGVAPPSNPLSALAAAGLGKAAWHALAAALLLFLAYGIRHARPRTSADAPSRRAFAEHVEATGALYHRAKAHEHAEATYRRFTELRAPKATQNAEKKTATLS